MSFAEFRNKVSADKEFANKFADVKSAEELVKAAAAEGYVFTVDDIRNDTSVTPADLEKAAGGRGVVVQLVFTDSGISDEFLRKIRQ